jgi:hypothetical protein
MSFGASRCYSEHRKKLADEVHSRCALESDVAVVAIDARYGAYITL